MAAITISRQFGSGADTIARRVGELVGYRYFDKQMMVEAAAESGLSEHEIVDFHEHSYKVRDWLERLLSPGPRVVAEVVKRQRSWTGRELLTVEKLDEDRCIALVQGLVRAAYEKGNVIIVGRGGQALLQGKPGVLHVRIEAPLEQRVMRIQEQEGLSLKAAEELACQRDRAAEAYLKRFYDIRWDDPLLYHLVLNTGKWNLETAAQLIADALKALLVQTPG
jgi:cytidylate kinase